MAPAYAAGVGGQVPGVGAGIEGAFTGPLSAGAIQPFIGPGGQMISGGGIPSAEGGATQGLFGQLAFGGRPSLESLMAAGGPLAVMAGLGLLTKAGGTGGPITGALGGAALGVGAAATMAAFGGTSIIGMTGAALLTTPIGWAVLAGIAGIGALIGAIGRGRAKRKAAAGEDEFHIAADELLAEFNPHQLDYESAVQGLQALEQQYKQIESQYGGPGRNAIAHIQSMAQERMNYLHQTEREREARATMIAGMTLPEFALGGMVPGLGFRLGNGLLAVLHPGEFVMRHEAVDALGTQFLAALNRAPRFDVGGPVGGQRMPAAVGQRVYHQTFNLYQLPGEEQHSFVNRVVRAVRQAESDGAL